MRRHFIAATTLISLLGLAACSPDMVAPKDGQAPGPNGAPLAAPAVGQSCTDAEVTADLTILMNRIGDRGERADAAAKWAYVKRLKSYNLPDSTAKAVVKANALNALIDHEYSELKKSEKSASITDSKGTTMTVTALTSQVKAEITCFVTATFTIPTTNAPVTVALPTADAGAYFPTGFCDAACGGINVVETQVDPCETTTPVPGCVLGTLLDKYGKYIKITLSGGTPNLANPVVVALCVPAGTDPTVAARLQVAHQNDGTVASTGLSVLDLPPGGIPTDLAAALTCANLALNDTGRPTTMLARMANRAADLLLPEKAMARMHYLGGLGIGGTTTKFSPFGLVDPRLSASGGIGGTKTTFAPSLATNLDGSLEDTTNFRQTTGLPKVQVKTTLGTPIPGVKVTFTAVPTLLAQYQPASLAAVCDGALANQSSITVLTGPTGEATLPCVNFGTKVGYKQIAATVDPTLTPGLSDDGGLNNVTIATCDPTCGAAGTTTTLYWLVKTNPGNPAKLVIRTQPSTSAQAGVAFGQQPVVEVQDASGNLVTGSVLGVTTTFDAIPGGSPTLTGATATAVAGVATFTNLAISGTTGGYKLTFGAGGVTGAISGTITLAAGAAAQLAITTQPGTAGAQAGLPVVPQPVLQVQDASGNPVLTPGIVVTASLTGSGALIGSPSVTTDAGGVATFSGLGITGATGSFNFTFTSPSLPGGAPVTSAGSITLTPGTAAKLVVTQQPSSTALAGVGFGQQPSVELRDGSNNLVTAAADQVSVTATITSGGAGTLGGTLAQTTAAGIATFTDLQIDGATGVRTLDFTSGSLTPDTSTPIAVNPGPAKKLVITAISTTVAAGELFAIQPMVEVQDQFGNKTASTASIGAAVSTGASLGAATTNPRNAVAGSATFSDLTIGGLGSPAPVRTLTFTSTGLDPATADVAVTVGPATKLIVTAISTTVAAGEPFAVPPVVQVQDQFSNPVTASAASIDAGASAGAIGGAHPVAASGGNATFTDLTIGGLGSPGNRVLTFSSTGLTSAISNLTVTSGPDKKLVITAGSTAVLAGVAFPVPAVVQVQDQFGNPTASTASILAGISAPGTLGGTNPQNGVAGNATFGNLTIGPVGSPGSRTVTFTSGTLTPDSRIITVGDPLPDWLAGGYRYLLPTPKQGGGPADFQLTTFNDAAWILAAAPFGSPSPLTYSNCTLYNSTATKPVTRTWTVGSSATNGGSDILVRKTFALLAATKVKVSFAIDNDVQVFLDGVDQTTGLGAPLLNGLAKHEGCATRPTTSAYTFTTATALTSGSHVLAIRARDRGGISYLDVKVIAVP